MSKPYFPLFVNLSDKNIVVAGGGTVAARRVRTLMKFTRNITVIAPQMAPPLLEMAKAGQIEAKFRPVKRTDFGEAYMVLAATDNWKVNDEIYRICKQEGIYVNVADDMDKCDFYFPGICMEQNLVVGVTASGKNHKKARELREQIQAVLKNLGADEEEKDE